MTGRDGWLTGTHRRTALQGVAQYIRNQAHSSAWRGAIMTGESIAQGNKHGLETLRASAQATCTRALHKACAGNTSCCAPSCEPTCMHALRQARAGNTSCCAPSCEPTCTHALRQARAGNASRGLCRQHARMHCASHGPPSGERTSHAFTCRLAPTRSTLLHRNTRYQLRHNAALHHQITARPNMNTDPMNPGEWVGSLATSTHESIVHGQANAHREH